MFFAHYFPSTLLLVLAELNHISDDAALVILSRAVLAYFKVQWYLVHRRLLLLLGGGAMLSDDYLLHLKCSCGTAQ